MCFLFSGTDASIFVCIFVYTHMCQDIITNGVYTEIFIVVYFINVFTISMSNNHTNVIYIYINKYLYIYLCKERKKERERMYSIERDC